jgi:hypothetical protein
VQAIPPSARYSATANCVHSYFQLSLDEGKQGPHNVHAAVRQMAVPAKTNGAISNLRRLVQEERLCHRRQQERKKDCGQHSLLGILCWGATMQELMKKLDTILLRCKAIGITLSIKKLKISKEVAFAGYVVNQGAIKPSPERAIALKEFP